MEISPTRVGAVLADRYAIEREIGSGGMATVYLARDLRHERKVALKVLSPELGAVVGSERFLSEIRVTANLQHPNLLPLFDSGESNGLLFYVMPFVDGVTLRDRLDKERQLPVDEAIRIATAIAGALNHAHRHGVVHRDLKPANILLHEGAPLVADFGIALAVSKAGGARVTQTGLSVGTPQYMSPEQATGDRVIDARSDIYSLAAVLHEMLTGDPPHMASTVSVIIAKILTELPQHVRAVRDSVPPHVDAALMRALSKLPADRFGTAAEFAEALTGERVAVTGPNQAAAYDLVPRARVSWRSRAKAALMWLPLLLGAGAAFTLVPDRSGGSRATLFQVTFADSMILTEHTGVDIALSHDGSQLAFTASGPEGVGIYIRSMSALDASLVRGTAALSSQPQFSPDGNWLLFHSDRDLLKVPRTGGIPVTIAEETRGASWSDRDEIVFATDSVLWRVPAGGGTRTRVAAIDPARGHLRYAWPHVLPGGKAVLLTIWRRSLKAEDAELAVVELPDGAVTELGLAGTNPKYLRSGHIVFGRLDGTLFAAPFSLRRLRLLDTEQQVMQDVQVSRDGAVDIAFADNGDAVYKTLQNAPYIRLVRVDRTGVARPLGLDSIGIGFPRIDPAGRRVAITFESEGEKDIWTMDLMSGTLTRVTKDAVSQRPEWSRDGKRIAYMNLSNPRGGIHWQTADGGGASEVYIDTALAEISLGPPDGYLAVRLAGSTNSDIWIAPVASPRELRPFVATPAHEKNPRVSPTGRLLAYVSDEGGLPQVFVRPLPGPEGRIQVSTDGGTEPVWSPDGRELFYRSRDYLMSATISQSPALDVLRTDTLFVDHYGRSNVGINFDVFPDGKDFVFVQTPALVSREGSGTGRLWGVAHWSADMQRHVQDAATR